MKKIVHWQLKIHKNMSGSDTWPGNLTNDEAIRLSKRRIREAIRLSKRRIREAIRLSKRRIREAIRLSKRRIRNKLAEVALDGLQTDKYFIEKIEIYKQKTLQKADEVMKHFKVTKVETITDDEEYKPVRKKCTSKRSGKK